MARAVWTGALGFALVNVPVGLYSAAQDRTIRFHQFERGTSDRIRLRRVNERTQEEVDYGDIVKGYDLGGGDYVMIAPDELEAAAPERTRTIAITDFVDLDEIDPVYYRKTYYVAPQGDAAERAYGLLRTAMAKAGKVAVGTMVMRTKEHLVAVRPQSSALVLETMFFADEVRDPVQEVEQLPVGGSYSERELAMAEQIIRTMASPWRPESYTDTFRQRVEELIERKREGADIVREAAPGPAPVVDLMEALRRSVQAARGEDLAGLSKAELARRAADLDVRGRSSMTKDELVAAVRDAERRKAS